MLTILFAGDLRPTQYATRLSYTNIHFEIYACSKLYMHNNTHHMKHIILYYFISHHIILYYIVSYQLYISYRIMSSISHTHVLRLCRLRAPRRQQHRGAGGLHPLSASRGPISIIIMINSMFTTISNTISSTSHISSMNCISIMNNTHISIIIINSIMRASSSECLAHRVAIYLIRVSVNQNTFLLGEPSPCKAAA